MRTSQETGTRARAGLFFQRAPSSGEAFHWNYAAGSASASPASLLTNERRPSRATKRPGWRLFARRCRRPAGAGARRGPPAIYSPRSTWSGASRPRRCGPTASRRRTGGAALAFCAWVLGRRRGLCEGLPREWGGGRVLPASRRSFVNPLMRRVDGLSLSCNAQRGSASHGGPHPVSISEGSGAA